jgi:hypothetical protein
MSHFALKEIESPRNNRFDRPVIACIGENYSLGRTVPTELVPMADIQSQGCCFDLLRRGDDGRASLSHDVLGRLCEVPQEPKVWILASKFASELAVIFRTSSGFSADAIVDICRQCVDRVYSGSALFEYCRSRQPNLSHLVARPHQETLLLSPSILQVGNIWHNVVDALQ